MDGQREPLHFLLDSGAASSVVSLDAARRLDLSLGRPLPVQGVHSQTTAFRIRRFEAQIAGIALPRSVLALDLEAVGATCHRPIDGLLGADFFRGRVVQIDFAEERIRLLDEARADSRSVILPVRMRNDAICVAVGVAGQPSQWLRLDTGCDSALEWVTGDARARDARGASVGLTSARADTIRVDVDLGGRTLRGIEAGVHHRQIFPREAGLLGTGLLSKFRVTVDGPGRRVILD